MLIDWVTASLDMDRVSPDLWDRLLLLSERVMRFCPRSGFDPTSGYIEIHTDDVRWSSSAWDSVRSDSHQIAFRVSGSSIAIQGSPGRVCGSGDAVFGEGPARALDVQECVRRMVAFVSGQVGFDLPMEPTLWHVTRIDVTANLLLDDLPAVRVALRILRECEGGRYRVSQQAGDTVYWSHRSRLRSGKAYAKGPHICHQLTQKGYTGRPYAPRELALLDRLLRLELRLGAQWLRERAGKAWHQLTPEDLRQEWRDYFEKMIGEADMTEENLFDRITEAAELIRIEQNRRALELHDDRLVRLSPQQQATIKPPRQIDSSEGAAKAAYAFYLLIQKEGWQKIRELHTRNGKPNNTYYRHLSILHRAGLGDLDISNGNVVPLRRKIIECQIIESWDDLLKAA